MTDGIPHIVSSELLSNWWLAETTSPLYDGDLGKAVAALLLPPIVKWGLAKLLSMLLLAEVDMLQP